MLRTRIFALIILGGLLTFAACGRTVTVNVTTTSTIVPPTISPTLAPPQCAAYFSATYVTSIPDTSYQATDVYAIIPLPPQTRFATSDATGGARMKGFCSGGTAASLQAFMTMHLTQLGWQLEQPGDQRPPLCMVNGKQDPQCWQNGTYALNLEIDSPTEWSILFHDPDYPNG